MNDHRGDATVPRSHSYCILLPTSEDILWWGQPWKYSCHVPESKGENKTRKVAVPTGGRKPCEDGSLVGNKFHMLLCDTAEKGSKDHYTI